VDFYEDLVFRYAITILSEKPEGKLLIHPQFHVSKDLQGDSWSADIDFLFLNLNKQIIYLVEVTSSSAKPEKIKIKLQHDYRTIVESYVKNDFIPTKLKNHEWKIVWQVYVRSRHIEWLKKEVGMDAVEFISIESVLDEIKERLK